MKANRIPYFVPVCDPGYSEDGFNPDQERLELGEVTQFLEGFQEYRQELSENGGYPLA